VPSRSEHLAKAESNQRLAIAFQNGPHVDWSVTVLFYAAWHLVEAALAPVHSTSHADRNQNIQRHPHLNAIYPYCRELYRRSLDARYDCVVFRTVQAQHLYVTRYEPIKRHLQPLLGLTS
jgi:hypothetical protein